MNDYHVWLYMAAYAWIPSAFMCFCANCLINGLYKQISCKTCLYAINSELTLDSLTSK